MKRILFLSAFSLLLSSCGSGVGDGVDVAGTTGDSKTSSKVVSAIAGVNTTRAKVYLGAGDDIFTVSNNGMTVYGNTGNDTVTIASGVTAVTLDQNIEQINFVDPSSSYTFKQTGNLINVYNLSGILVVKAPVQGDSDGTLLSFNNGVPKSAKLTGGVMTLDGVLVISDPPTTTTSTTTTSTTTTTIPTGSVTVTW